jgi:outer membrane receptor protein involved in Fe transport
VVQWDIAGFLQEDVRFTSWLRVILGVRGDLFRWQVTDTDPHRTPDVPARTTFETGIVNPKLQTIITPHTGWELYLDAGGGFHSNDARAVVAQGGSGALPRAWGAEVGTRLSLLDRRLELAAAFWGLRLQSELVFIADEGTTEASASTDRYGVDLEARFGIVPWMWAEFDLSLAHAAYTRDSGNGSAVALAPTFTGQAGLNVLHPSGWRGRLGARWVGDRAATEDRSLTAPGYFIVDVSAAYRWRFVEVGVVVENVLNSSWREAQFANASYVAGRDDPLYAVSGREDIHFTPGNPINARVTLGLFF